MVLVATIALFVGASAKKRDSAVTAAVFCAEENSTLAHLINECVWEPRSIFSLPPLPLTLLQAPFCCPHACPTLGYIHAALLALKPCHNYILGEQ